MVSMLLQQKEKSNEIIRMEFTQKLTQLIEEFNTNEFVEEIGDKIHQETGLELTNEEIKEEIGKVFLPLLPMFSDIGLQLHKL